eukprot:359139-Chlamydomonas_euryale.AAC.15
MTTPVQCFCSWRGLLRLQRAPLLRCRSNSTAVRYGITQYDNTALYYTVHCFATRCDAMVWQYGAAVPCNKHADCVHGAAQTAWFDAVFREAPRAGASQASIVCSPSICGAKQRHAWHC